ncbi:retropepsin-like aspartic protease [Natranaerofaba carboxydovora]|uniref:retropepsin-like aspartic protease n=1 Tax=Natranaerofaba carboxydovora TaxID=2742683 RepID=UPI001F134854|nr:retropepsin-like aspartic protease [Natranaerofaba carboxydovora]
MSNVLVDTGAASTLLSADVAMNLGLGPNPEDKIYTISGVGGNEFVYEKKIEEIKLCNLILTEFLVQIGAMDYGLEIDGILGMDYLIQSKSVIDTYNLYISSSN